MAKPGAADRKMADGNGLFLLVRPNGSKLWRLKYRFFGKEKQLALGAYPDVTLEQARSRRREARAQLADGLDPGTEKKKRKTAAAAIAHNTFQKMALAWHEAQSVARNPRYAGQILSRLQADVFPRVGSIPVDQVTAPMVLDLLRRIEARGAKEMARKVRMHISHVFSWAISAGIAQNNPALLVAKALAPKQTSLRPAVLTLQEARGVLAKSEAYPDVYWATRLASRLLALTAARPGNATDAERGEFEDLDGDLPIWRIPAAKLKLKQEHQRDRRYDFRIPLSRQAVDTVKAAMSAARPLPTGPQWLFPGIGDRRRPISDSTLSGHYLDVGLRGVHVPHGWRSTFSTIMNERAAAQGREGDRGIIDMMLAHLQTGVEPIYNRSNYMPRRREIAQEWADLLMKDLPGPETLLPMR